MERDKDKALSVLEEKLRLSEALCHNKDAKIAEKEADLAEAQELNDQKDRIIRKAMKEIDDFKARIEAITKRQAEVEKQRAKEKKELEEKIKREANSKSPSKERLKQELEKSASTIKCLTGRQENLKKDLEIAKRNQRRQEADTVTYQKLQLSFEQTLKKLAEVEQELDKFKKEKAALLKKIPCTLENCDRGRFCENSHHLRYDDRTEPRDADWRKSVPCRHFLRGHCYDGDSCKFLHVKPKVPEPREERRDNRRDWNKTQDSEDDQSLEEMVNWHRFRNVVENNDSGSGYGSREGSRDISVEITGEYRRNDSKSKPQKKRMRFDNSNGDSEMRSGNGGGADERSRRSVPLNIQRSQERMPTLRMRMENSRRSVEERMMPGPSRQRNWSPIRSPEDLNRSRPRDRDLREEMNSRRGRGGQSNRGRSASARGRGPKTSGREDRQRY